MTLPWDYNPISGGKYFPQFENQGIDPVKEYLKCVHKNKKLAPNAMKGL